MIAFVCAMPTERDPLVAKLGLRRDADDTIDARVGSLGVHDVVAVVTGMGTDLARAGTRRMLDRFDVREVVVVGVAGGVEDTTPIGRVVAPDEVVNSHTGARFRPSALGPSPRRGVLWTTDVILSGDEVIEDLRGHGVVGLDMETAAVAEVCEAAGVPWSVFRAISDQPTDEVDVEVFRLSNQDGTPNVGNIVRYVVRRPHRVPRLARMGRNLRTATHAAADAAIAAVQRLPAN